MSFRIQHPDSGLFWDADESGQMILTAQGAVYELDQIWGTAENSHIRNTATDNWVYANDSNIEERGHFGAMTRFEWTIDADGTIHNDYVPVVVTGDFSYGPSFQWKIVPVTRAQAVLAQASQPAPPTPAPAPPSPEPESEPEHEDEVPDADSEPEH